MNNLINRAAVKRMALQFAADTRAQKFTRVSKSFLDDAEAALNAHIRAKVAAMPSKGVTLR